MKEKQRGKISDFLFLNRNRGTYLSRFFTRHIKRSEINVIFELGARDLIDSNRLQQYYDATIYSFECSPDCLEVCDKNYRKLNNPHINLVKKAVCEENKPIKFYPFDLTKYDNMGSSSLFKIDFSIRNDDDPDKNRENPQREIIVDGIRLDDFCSENNIRNVDLLCIDLQGAELIALKSLGKYLNTVKHVITEVSVNPSYIGAANFIEVNGYLKKFGFNYVCSIKWGNKMPDLTLKGFSEFDCLFSKRPSSLLCRVQNSLHMLFCAVRSKVVAQYPSGEYRLS